MERMHSKDGAPKRDARFTLEGRAFRAGSYSLAAAAMVIAIAIALNLLFGTLPSAYTKLDMTADRMYSLSDQTDKVLSNLKDDVTVYWIVQGGVEDSRMQLLLDRYQSASNKITIAKKDPIVNPNFAEQYTSSQLYNNSLIVVCGDRSKYVSYYSIYSTTPPTSSGGESVTVFAGEGALTSAIDYVTNEDLPVVYRLTGHGEADLPDDLSDAVSGDNIMLKDLNLLSTGTIPEDADSLLIYGPQRDLTDAEKDAILSYLQSGGRMLLVTDYIEGGTPNLDAITEYYGMNRVQGIVIEGNSNYCLSGYYHYLLPDYGNHAIVTPLKSGGYYVLMPAAQGLTVAEGTRSSLSISRLLTTSDSAYSKLSGYSISTFEKEAGDIDGPFVLGVLIEEATANAKTGIVWLTTSLMFNADYNNLVAGTNYDLFLNSLGYLCERESAISIRAKSLTGQALTIPTAHATWLIVLMVGVLPLALVATGVTVMVIRRRK